MKARNKSIIFVLSYFRVFVIGVFLFRLSVISLFFYGKQLFYELSFAYISLDNQFSRHSNIPLSITVSPVAVLTVRQTA